jgi:hypothetical protein
MLLADGARRVCAGLQPEQTDLCHVDTNVADGDSPRAWY